MGGCMPKAEKEPANTSKKLQQNEIKYDGSKLFYPTYCYAKTSTLQLNNALNDNKENETKNEFEYYMSVGLNSNIKTDEFDRKHLNLIIVLDISGSMSSQFSEDNSNKTKMTIANESVVTLLNHLTPNDMFCLITFESHAQVIQKLKFVKDININKLKTKILNIKSTGGTNFEKGYKAAIREYNNQLFNHKQNKKQYLNDINQYDNRIIILTDAQPNMGTTDPNSLLNLVSKCAKGDQTVISMNYDDEKLEESSNCDSNCDIYQSQYNYCSRELYNDECSMSRSMDMHARCEMSMSDSDKIGLAVGGARDNNNFRQCIEQNIMPSKNSITFNGLLYEYYFDTKKRKYSNSNNYKCVIQNDNNNRNDTKNIFRIYTTFIGIGLDFNTDLIQTISKTRGCNYFAVKSTKEFMERMNNKEFEHMVTPLVFNVCLKLKCEGNICQIEKIYGTNDKKTKNILENGEIVKIDTLFPSKKSKKKGGVKGGIQLIKLKKVNCDEINTENENINVEIEVSFEDRYGNVYTNTQFVTFKSPKLEIKASDMIESDSDEEEMNDNTHNSFDNIGIRKAIVLCKYVELLHLWIEDLGSYGNDKLRINDKYREIFSKFLKHFKKEMRKCKDKELEQEIKIIQKLVQL